MRWLMILGLLLVASCSNEPPPEGVPVSWSVRLTDSQGVVHTLQKAQVNYEHFVMTGQYRQAGDPETAGFRTVGALLPWASLASFTVVGRETRTVDHLPGFPIAELLLADVLLKDGRRQAMKLLDTPDWGLTGECELGAVVIPLRNVERLETLEAGPVAKVGGGKEETPPDQVYLQILTVDGSIKRGQLRWISHDWEKHILHIPDKEGHGVRVRVGAARVTLPWTRVERVTLTTSGTAREPVVSGVFHFTDGSQGTYPLDLFGNANLYFVNFDSFFLGDLREIKVVERRWY